MALLEHEKAQNDGITNLKVIVSTELDRIESIKTVESRLSHFPLKLKYTRSYIRRVKGSDDSSFIDPKSLRTLRILGEGSFATVELCRIKGADNQSKFVAVKRLKNTNKQDARDFASECATLRKLRHPNLVKFVGIGSNNNGTEKEELRSLFLVQEYVPGGTLRDLLFRQEITSSPLYTNAQAVDISLGIARGLAYLHTLLPNKVLHRDVKPANILLKQSREVSCGGPGRKVFTAKIGDFGLAKVMDHTQAANDTAIFKTSATKYTNRGAPNNFQLTGQTGSLLYMAPEVFKVSSSPGKRQAKYDESSDIFSLGLIMYELFNRRLREGFIQMDSGPVNCAIQMATGRRPQLPGKWPEELQALISDCWHQVPESRPSATDVCNRLETLKPIVAQSMDTSNRHHFFRCF